MRGDLRRCWQTEQSEGRTLSNATRPRTANASSQPCIGQTSVPGVKAVRVRDDVGAMVERWVVGGMALVERAPAALEQDRHTGGDGTKREVGVLAAVAGKALVEAAKPVERFAARTAKASDQNRPAFGAGLTPLIREDAGGVAPALRAETLISPAVLDCLRQVESLAADQPVVRAGRRLERADQVPRGNAIDVEKHQDLALCLLPSEVSGPCQSQSFIGRMHDGDAGWKEERAAVHGHDDRLIGNAQAARHAFETPREMRVAAVVHRDQAKAVQLRSVRCSSTS